MGQDITRVTANCWLAQLTVQLAVQTWSSENQRSLGALESPEASRLACLLEVDISEQTIYRRQNVS